jgi:hypothetical protein
LHYLNATGANQRDPESSSCSVQPSFNGALGHAQMRCQLSVAPILGVLQQENFCVPWRQVFKRGAHLNSPLILKQPIKRIAMGRTFLGADLALGKLVKGFTLPASFAAKEQGLPDRNPIEPWADATRISQGSAWSDCSQRDLLHDFIEGLSFTQAGKDDSAEPPIVLRKRGRPVNPDRTTPVRRLVGVRQVRQFDHVNRIVTARQKIFRGRAKNLSQTPWLNFSMKIGKHKHFF